MIQSSAPERRMENNVQIVIVPVFLVTSHYQHDESGKATMGRAFRKNEK
jgi:hypothetical protein